MRPWPLALVLAGCLTPTQAVVFFDADGALRPQAREITIAISVVGADGVITPISERSAPVSSSDFPVPFFVHPSSGDGDRVARVSAELRGEGGRVLGRQNVVVQYVSERLSTFVVTFGADCTARLDCGALGTCNAGECVSACYEASLSGSMSPSRSVECAGSVCTEQDDGAPCVEGGRVGRCWGAECCDGCLDDFSADAAGGAECRRGAAAREALHCGALGRRCEICEPSEICGPESCQSSGGSVPPMVVAVATHTCVRPRCWGARAETLWTAPTTSPQSRPTCVDRPSFADPTMSGSFTGWFASGEGCTCRAEYAGDRWECWGHPECTSDYLRVELLRAPSAEVRFLVVEDFAVGSRHVCAHGVGRLACFGDGDAGQLGGPVDADGVARPLDALRVAGARASGEHTCAFSEDGEVWCWGTSARGAVIGGPDPTRVMLPGRVISVATGASGTCAVTEVAQSAVRRGRLFCWGELLDAGGGLDTLDTEGLPTGVRELAGGPFLAAADEAVVAIGDLHVCAIRIDDVIVCAGDNTHGQLGQDDGSRGALRPIDQPGRAFRRVSAGSRHTCASRSDGTVWCWGDGRDGQLGVASAQGERNPLPLRVRDLGECP